MKKAHIIFLTIILILALSGCNTSTSKVMYQNKEVEKIEITSLKTKQKHDLTKYDDVEKFVSELKNNNKTRFSIDQEALKAINSKISLVYKDGFKQEYSVLIGDEAQISLLEDTKGMVTNGYKFNSKEVANLLEK